MLAGMFLELVIKNSVGIYNLSKHFTCSVYSKRVRYRAVSYLIEIARRPDIRTVDVPEK